MALFISVEVSTLSHRGLHGQVIKNAMSRLILLHCADYQDALQRSSLGNSEVIIAWRRPKCFDCYLSCARATTFGATKAGNARVHRRHSSLAITSGSSGEQQS